MLYEHTLWSFFRAPSPIRGENRNAFPPITFIKGSAFPSVLHGVQLIRRSKAKFRGVILDKKLIWIENIIQSPRIC